MTDRERLNIEDLRDFVLALDGVEERSHHGKPDFRLRGKIIVNLDEEDRSITIKLPLDDQAALFDRPGPGFSRPGGWAKHGWTTISLRDVSSDEVKGLVLEAYEHSRT